MHVEDTDTATLKQWIVPKLEKISDADSDVLADYVIALVKADDSDADVKQNCHESLPDFLHEHTASFVEEVIDAVKTKSFLPGYVPPSRSNTLSAEAPPFNPPTGPAAGVNKQANLPGLGGGANSGRGDQSRKRTRESSESRDGRDPHYSRNAGGDRQMKQMRRGGRHGRGGFGTQNPNMGGMPGLGGMGGMPNLPALPGSMQPPSGFPPMDPNNPLAGLLAMQAMGFPLPGMPPLPNAGSPTSFGQSASSGGELPAGRKGRCKDYDTKGYCTLGSVCPYEHGDDHLVVNDEYDPNQASLAVKSGLNGRGLQDARRGGDRGRGRGGGRGDRGGFAGNRNRAPFSHAGPMNDRSNTTIVVEQVPEENFDEQSVRNFFSDFGNITGIEMHAYKRLAIVKFEDHASARRAYDSTKPIFDNRFVKVYWYKPETLPAPPAHANGRASPSSEAKQDEEMIDPAEVERKQAEAQKAYEEKLKKRQEAENQREDVQNRLKEAEEKRKKLLEKIAAKTGGKIGATEDTSAASPTTGEKALEQELAALKAEANSLGIEGEDGTNGSTQTPPLGRGRGGYRGRGTFVPRGRGFAPFRGSHRGRGGFAGYSPFGANRGGIKRLDNRPKRVVVGGIEVGTPRDETLRQHLIHNFEHESIDQHPERKDAQVITFKERWAAEKFIEEASNIPDIGKVELSWMSNPPIAPTTTTSSTPKSDQATTENDVKMDEQTNGGAEGSVGGGEADYDVADDEDRWMEN